MVVEEKDNGIPGDDQVQGGALGDGTGDMGNGDKRSVGPALSHGDKGNILLNTGAIAALVSQARSLFESGVQVEEISRQTGLAVTKINTLILAGKWSSELKYAKIIRDLPTDTFAVKRCILARIANGETPSLAARALGIRNDELQYMLANDLEFQLQAASCRANFLTEQELKVAESPDWRASLEVLRRAKETKADWSDPTKEKPSLVIELHVDRGLKD